MSTQKIYLITGCSSGLGYCLAQAALATGAKVIATARDPQKNEEVYETLKAAGAIWAPLNLSSPYHPLEMHGLLSEHERIDVLINNAGTGGSVRPVEELMVQDAQWLFETNLWGPMRTTQLVLPLMRRQQSGCIVNVSSAAVFETPPGIGVYAASKAALDALTGAMAAEIAPFGVKMVLVTPSDMRTPFIARHKKEEIMPELWDMYQDGPVEQTRQYLSAISGRQPVDPEEAAARIIEAVEKSAEHQGPAMIRLPIGVNAAKSMRAWANDLLLQVEQTEEVWKSVDYE